MLVLAMRCQSAAYSSLRCFGSRNRDDQVFAPLRIAGQLLRAPDGVAGALSGWKGLSSGIILQSLQAVCGWRVKPSMFFFAIVHHRRHFDIHQLILNPALSDFSMSSRIIRLRKRAGWKLACRWERELGELGVILHALVEQLDVAFLIVVFGSRSPSLKSRMFCSMTSARRMPVALISSWRWRRPCGRTPGGPCNARENRSARR
jgi:hypothetical protein